MGFLKHMLLGDFGQSLDIEEQSASIQTQQKIQQQQARSLRSKDIEIARLQARTERLHLAIAGLTKYLTTHGIVNESDLAAYLDEIDSADGVKDGRHPMSDPPSTGPRRLNTPPL